MADHRSNAPYLGRGWSFPPRFDREGGPAMVRGTDDIKESLRVLIGTRLGERIMLPLYGTPLETFSGMTVTAMNNIKTQVREAIIRYEPRVDVLSVDVKAPEGGLDGELLVIVDYDVPAVNNRANMVFPFYLKEGNLVRVRPDPDDAAGGDTG